MADKYLIYSAAMTPLKDNGELDIQSMERMVERNLTAGIDGFFFAWDNGRRVSSSGSY